MVGFRDRSGTCWDVQVPPGPRLGVVIDCTTGSLRPVGSSAYEGAVVAGIAPSPTRIATEGVEVLQVELDPMMANRLLGVSLTELSGPMLDLRDLWGPYAVQLRERLVTTESWQERFTLVGDALARRLSRECRVDPEVADAWRQITASCGQVRVTTLAQRYGWSRTRLWGRFKTQVGVTPKRAAMVARFDHALVSLGSGAGPARVAAECGYADQAHLSREVLEFSGRTPREIAGDPLWQFHSNVIAES